MIRKRLLALTALCSGLAPAALAQEALPDIEVGAPLRSRSAPAAPAPPSPAPAPAGVAAAPAPAPPPPAPVLSTAPSSVIITTAKEIADTRQFDISGALDRSTPGVSTDDVLGNPFSPQVDFRGFVASPVSGTPEGLAVYQNGVRINEAYGDTGQLGLDPHRRHRPQRHRHRQSAVRTQRARRRRRARYEERLFVSGLRSRRTHGQPQSPADHDAIWRSAGRFRQLSRDRGRRRQRLSQIFWARRCAASMATSAIAAIRRKCISRSASRKTDLASAARPRSISLIMTQAPFTPRRRRTRTRCRNMI